MHNEYSFLGYLLFALCLSPFVIIILCVPIKFRAIVVAVLVAYVIYTQIDYRSWEDGPVAEVRYMDLTKTETGPALCHNLRSELWTPVYDKRTRAQQISEDEKLKRNTANMSLFRGQAPREAACLVKSKITSRSLMRSLPSTSPSSRNISRI